VRPEAYSDTNPIAFTVRPEAYSDTNLIAFTVRPEAYSDTNLIAFTVRLTVVPYPFVLDHSSSVFRRRGKPRL